MSVLALLYLFLVAIQMLGGTFKDLGKAQATSLIAHISNPFAALAVGVLATVLVQSSSVTTSTIVGIVGSMMVSRGGPGQEQDLAKFLTPFVPMVMGANIGTTITNTLVSLGHVTRTLEFQRAFAGATVHDFFNVLAVIILLPLQLATGFLSRSAAALVDLLDLGQGVEFKSPVKAAVKAAAQTVKEAIEALGLEGTVLSVAMVLVAIALIFFSLVFITGNMKRLMAARVETAINNALARSGLLAMVIGMLVTVSVQSSSITTSLLVPAFGAGLITLENGYPIMLGANVGTTVTALLAAVAAGPAGLAIAIVHLLFNLSGILIFYPFPPLRRIPIRLARALAARTVLSRWWILGYVGGVFVVLPLLGILIFG